MKHLITTPIACSLANAEFREREATLLQQFRSAVVETKELPEGFAFRLSGDGKLIHLITELIVAERECCPFLQFEVVTLPNKGPAIVRVTGPAGAKQFVRSVFMSLGEAYPIGEDDAANFDKVRSG